MKKGIYLFLTVLIVACGNSDDSGNSSNNLDGVDYFFEVEFGGVVNRVEGNTSSLAPNGLQPWLLYNQCYGTTDAAILSISDITAENYVSGQNMSITMVFDNAQLGSNTGIIPNNFINGSFYMQEYLDSIGASSAGFVENIGDGFGQRGIISNINITDLGTQGTALGTGGETIKASYEKVVYFRSIDTGDYDIPVPIRIEFSAVRI
tara:strand:- start:5466 stop:6083 length:618 start_codon:yes stop_codon:yes gene_type:complete